MEQQAASQSPIATLGSPALYVAPSDVIEIVGKISQQSLTIAIVENRKLREISGQKVQALMDQWPTIDENTDLLQTDKLDVLMADAQSKVDSCITICENRRKPLTQKFDEIRGLFTAEEKALQGMKDAIAASRVTWQKEKIRRDAKRKADADAVLIKNAEAIDITAAAKTSFQTLLLRMIADNIKAVNEKYNSHTIETLPSYIPKLQAWTPGFTQDKSVFCRSGATWTWFYHSQEEVQGIVAKAYQESELSAGAVYSREMNNEKNRLLEMVPSRLAELERAKTAQGKIDMDARLLREQAERESATTAAVADVAQAGAVSAEAAKHEQVFEAVASAGPAIQVAKGTTQKKKYAPVTMAEHHKILVYWVEKAMGKLNQDELLKKLSFMRTFADAALNNGEVIPGIPVIDDVSVRGRRKEEGE
jgi:hypothetical protein